MENHCSISFYMNGDVLGTANYDTEHISTDRHSRWNAARVMNIAQYDRFIIWNNDKITLDSDKIKIFKWVKIFGIKIFKYDLIQSEIKNYIE